ncbi:MAG: hypothetical protein WKF73_07700 [Nocardioidaceae bacterium]
MTEESHAPGGPHPRATKYSPNGTYEDVSDKLVGAGSFLDSWERSPEIPQEFRGSGWQGPDEDHPPGSGQPAYRVVYKTMRLVPYPAIVLNWPNLRVSIVNGDFDRGGMYAPTAIPARTRRHYVIPEYGRVIESPSGGTTYLSGPDMTAAMSGWQETVKAASAVEIIIHVDVDNAEDYSAMMVAGRRSVASLKTLLDLQLGPRLLAMPLTEEVGETFDDWHWNRRIDTGSISLESQAEWRQLEAAPTLDTLLPLLEAEQNLSTEERQRIEAGEPVVLARRRRRRQHDPLCILVASRREPGDGQDDRYQAGTREASRHLRQQRVGLAESRGPTFWPPKQSGPRGTVGGSGGQRQECRGSGARPAFKQTARGHFRLAPSRAARAADLPS